MKSLHYEEAYLLLALLQNNHLPHTARLKSFRNHIRLIDKGHTPIYRNNISQRQRIHPQSRRNHIQVSQSMNVCTDQWDRGSGMTRTSFLLFFVGNCYGSDVCSPAPSLGAGITLFQSRISSSQ